MEWCRFCKFLQIFFFISLVSSVTSEKIYQLCYYKEIWSGVCNALKLGDSKVNCVKALDMADCAIMLNEGRADFGIFSAEGLMLAHQFYPDELTVIAELRHRQRLNEDFMFETVAVASSKYQPSSSPLKGNGFCHPGFNDTSTWTDYVLKYFEKEMYGRTKCQDKLSSAENEVFQLREYFGRACRPGKWVLNTTLDIQLKRKYPELCSLCDGPDCRYLNSEHHGQYGALDCLINKRGAVAYVALSYVEHYFKNMEEGSLKRLNENDFKFVCRGGNVQPLNVSKPCAWIKQPWNAVVARKSIADELYIDLKSWKSSNFPANNWRQVVLSILQTGYVNINFFEGTMSAELFLSRGRVIKIPKPACGNSIRWCTLNDTETTKCQWIAAEANILGIEPSITCNQTVKIDRSLMPASRESNLFQCFSKIARNEADIMTVESNYGSLVRQVYNLSNVLYCATSVDDYSVVLTILKENNTSSIRKFEDLKNRKACFPEYGGIAWLSFLNIARQKGLVKNHCDYPKIVADFFSGTCAPGVAEEYRWNQSPSAKVIDKLCSVCTSSDNDERRVCTANRSNRYYGNLGAMKCLQDGSGDVAFIETQQLESLLIYNLNPSEYRVLCKNGSLATYTGFKVDDECALSVAIDSEVVSRRKNSPIDTLNIKQALLRIHQWLGYRSDEFSPIRIYEPFNNTKDLLFKSSTNGLFDSSVSISAIDTYKDIMSHVDMCSGTGPTVIYNFSTFLVLVLFYAMLC